MHRCQFQRAATLPVMTTTTAYYTRRWRLHQYVPRSSQFDMEVNASPSRLQPSGESLSYSPVITTMSEACLEQTADLCQVGVRVVMQDAFVVQGVRQ